MDNNKKDAIAILGLGKVGAALGFLLKSSGYNVAAVSDRSAEALKRGIRYTGGEIYPDPLQAALRAKIIFITTCDDSIKSVCDEISKNGGVAPGKKVVHTSGASGLDLLESARDSGAKVASIHPIQSFADTAGAIENIPGSTFGITSEEEIKNWSVQIVKDIGGIPFLVSEKDKPLYHAAACIASNYLVTLMDTALEVYCALGLNPEEATKAFWPLVRGTIKNMERRGITRSLTGPISRGDIETLKKHILALKNGTPKFLNLYCNMGALTADLGIKNETLSAEKSEQIKSLFKEGTKK
jgi:predicted short-subunit dehydrogenase-like oxidoreductase (DUF2520 family)